MDFRPTGAWRKRTAAIRGMRRSLVRSGELSLLNARTAFGGAARVTGSYQVPVVLIRPMNVAEPYLPAAYQDLFFSPAPATRPYSLKTFYEQLSNGNITLDGTVLGWVVADSSDTYYEAGCKGIFCSAGLARLGLMLTGALNDLPSVDWRQFDNDGPDGIPDSGDDDGVVDFVAFVQPEVGGECGGSNIWSHRYTISGLTGGSPYVTTVDWAGHPGEKIKIDDYTIQGGVGGTTACDPAAIMPIGTVAHETGHAFGLPDLYNTDLTASMGVGEWSLMGSGNYTRPYSPSRYDAWSLLELGWVAVDTIRTNGTITLNPVSSADTVLLIRVPLTDEFFLLENRQALESDSAQMDPSYARAKSPGLLVWHIDQGQVDAHGFNGDNRVNAVSPPGVALVQSDGRNDLLNGANRGDRSDSWPGSLNRSRFSLTTAPAAVDNQGAYAGFILDSIRLATPGTPGPVTFRYTRRAPSVFAAARQGPNILVNGAAVNRLVDAFPAGDVIALDVPTIQLDSSGQGRYTFAGWSNAGARTQSFISGASPDTVIAAFSAEFQARYAIAGAGTGTVAVDSAGDFGPGVFLAEHDTVTFTATASLGSTFVRWSGDTSTTNRKLRLPMARGYAVTATFAAPVTVTLEQAVAVILGTGSLTAQQVQFLDDSGNRNGAYDLGDLLAYMDAHGLAPAPGPIARSPAPPRNVR